MELGRLTVGGCAVATMIGAATTGCGAGQNSSAPTSSTTPVMSSSSSSAVTGPAPGQPADYGALLIKPSDIGSDITAPQPPVLNPDNGAGVAQLFVNADSSRRIGDTILILADPAAAAAGAENTKANYAGKVSGAWQPADVGSNGAMISGNSPDNSRAVTVLLFTEGKALVDMEFDSAPTDPMDPDMVRQVGRTQDAAIKNGLPG